LPQSILSISSASTLNTSSRQSSTATVGQRQPASGSSNVDDPNIDPRLLVIADIDANIDPKVLFTEDNEQNARHLLGVIRGTATASNDDDPLATAGDRRTDELEDELFIEALLDDDDGEQEPLQLPVLQFINYFASINTVLKAGKPCSPKGLAAVGHATGNSRNPLEQFTKNCIHQRQGCIFRSHSMYTLERHESDKCIYGRTHLQKNF
jgi:hypothetical protein